MARNKLSDLNDHLFAQIERLNDEDFDDVQIERETKRANALSGLASQIIGTHKIVLDAAKLVANNKNGVKGLPETFGLNKPDKPDSD